MKRYVKYLVVVVALAFFSSVFANTVCPAAKVLGVQNANGKVVILLEGTGGHWLMLAAYGLVPTSTSIAVVQSYISMALTAMAAGKTVTLIYPDGISCTADNYNTSVIAFQVNSN